MILQENPHEFGTYHIFLKAKKKRTYSRIKGTRVLNFGLRFHELPYIMYTNSRNTGDSMHMDRLA